MSNGRTITNHDNHQKNNNHSHKSDYYNHKRRDSPSRHNEKYYGESNNDYNHNDRNVYNSHTSNSYSTTNRIQSRPSAISRDSWEQSSNRSPPTSRNYHLYEKKSDELSSNHYSNSRPNDANRHEYRCRKGPG